MNIDTRLLEDCHVLGTLDHASVLLNWNAGAGWLILVPATPAIDWYELNDAEHERVSRHIRALSAFTARWFDADKLNAATLGNVVRRLHIHMIARHRGDPCWPKSVWGHLELSHRYSPIAVDALRHALTRDMALVPGGRA